MRIKVVNKSKHPLPSYATNASAGMDLKANIENNIIIDPKQRELIPTGHFVEIPVGYEAQISPGSGLAIKKGIGIVNSRGTIDADYRGEVCIILMKKQRIISIIVLVLILSIISCARKLTPSAIDKGQMKPYDSAKFEYYFVEAVKLKLLGNTGEALELLENCIKINPESDAAYFQMAQIALAVGNQNKGRIYAGKALSLDQKNIWYIMLMAGSYFNDTEIDSAIFYYEKAVKIYPEKEDLLLTLGNLYSENKKYDKAEQIFKKFDTKYGVNEASTVANIRNMIMAEKYSDALTLTQLLLEEYPEEIMYNGLLAEIYRGLGDSQKAMDVYNKLIERNPDNPGTQLSLCDFLINEKKYDELFVFMNTVMMNAKITREDKISLIARLIEIPELIQEKSDPLEISVMVLEANYSNDDIIMLLKPELYIKQNKLKEAASRLEEIISANPDNYFAWEKLLLVYLQDGNFKKLQERAKECATKFNRSFLAKVLFASAATENKDYDIALEELRKATILAGDDKDMNMQVLSIKADIYYRQKNYEKAFETFDEALKQDKQDLTILNNYAYYLAEQDLRLKEAEEMAREVIETEKNNTTFLDTYGWVLYKRGKLREAEKIMQTIINSGEKPDAEWYEHLGYIMKKQRDCTNAVINWNLALKLDSTKSNLIEEIEKCQNSR